MVATSMLTIYFLMKTKEKRTYFCLLFVRFFSHFIWDKWFSSCSSDVIWCVRVCVSTRLSRFALHWHCVNISFRFSWLFSLFHSSISIEFVRASLLSGYSDKWRVKWFSDQVHFMISFFLLTQWFKCQSLWINKSRQISSEMCSRDHEN